MSKIIKEDDTYIYLYRYVHDDPYEYSEWELDSEGNKKYIDMIHEAEHYACYELRIDYKINRRTGEVEILGAK